MSFVLIPVSQYPNTVRLGFVYRLTTTYTKRDAMAARKRRREPVPRRQTGWDVFAYVLFIRLFNPPPDLHNSQRRKCLEQRCEELEW
jgi:hypothetical protein